MQIDLQLSFSFLNTSAPQGCVLSPLLYSIYTHFCRSHSSSVSLVKFADDTSVVGLISNNNETASRSEVEQLVEVVLVVVQNKNSHSTSQKPRSWLLISEGRRSPPPSLHETGSTDLFHRVMPWLTIQLRQLPGES